MYTYFKKEHKEFLIEIIKKLSEDYIFSSWHVTPVFTVEDIEDDDEDVRFVIEYEDPTDECTRHRHDAFDIALAYVAGYFAAKGIK